MQGNIQNNNTKINPAPPAKTKLKTDDKTDLYFGYLMNNEKFNESRRDELDRRMENDMRLHEKYLEQKAKKGGPPSPYDSDEPEELPSTDNPNKNRDRKPVPGQADQKRLTDRRDRDGHRRRVDFNSESDSGYSSRSASSRSGSNSSHRNRNRTRSPYDQKIDPLKPLTIQQLNPNANIAAPIPAATPTSAVTHLPGAVVVKEQHIAVPPAKPEKKPETREERRARTRTLLHQLNDLKKKHGIELSTNYDMNSDPDEMEREYNMHRKFKRRDNQVAFYKKALLNIVFGIEIFNEKFDPFSLKLKNWTQQMSIDIDDYTEVFEELHEKYNAEGGRMAPELKLILMIAMSAATFHISNAYFGAEGLGEIFKKNPSLMKEFSKNKRLKKDDDEDDDADTETDSPRSHKKANADILDALRNRHQKKSGKSQKSERSDSDSESESDSDSASVTTAKSATKFKTKSVSKSVSKSESMEAERKRIAEECRKEFALELKKVSEAHDIQMKHMQDRYEHMIALRAQTPPPMMPPLPVMTPPIYTQVMPTVPITPALAPTPKPVQVIPKKVASPKKAAEDETETESETDSDVLSDIMGEDFISPSPKNKKQEQSETDRLTKLSSSSIPKKSKNIIREFQKLDESTDDMDADDLNESSDEKKKPAKRAPLATKSVTASVAKGRGGKNPNSLSDLNSISRRAKTHVL